jgi:hypothetical protein
MDAYKLNEQETRARYITPAAGNAGRKVKHIREEYVFTSGRIHICNAQAARTALRDAALADAG